MFFFHSQAHTLTKMLRSGANLKLASGTNSRNGAEENGQNKDL